MTADQQHFAAYEYAKGGQTRAYTGRIDDDDGHPPASTTVRGDTITNATRPGPRCANRAFDFATPAR